MNITNMTDDQKRVKIAEACGKHQYYGMLYQGSHCTECGELFGEPQHYVRPPDYLNDLNAMHEAEKVLGGDPSIWNQQDAYMKALGKIVGRGIAEVWTVSHATARQRADAFLLTLP